MNMETLDKNEREELMTRLIKAEACYIPKRKAIQIAVGGPYNGDMVLLALCNDGSIFQLTEDTNALTWQRLPDIPQDHKKSGLEQQPAQRYPQTTQEKETGSD